MRQGGKRVKKISVLEYANLIGLSIKTIYKKINKGEIPHILESGKKLVIVEDDTYFKLLERNRSLDGDYIEKNEETIETEYVQDGEIINDSPGEQSFNIIRMENATFENLIHSIKDLSDKRAETYEETIKRLQEEYYECRAENKKLIEENKELTIKLAEAEVNYRIGDIRVKELENKREKTREQLSKKEQELLKLQAESIKLNDCVNELKQLKANLEKENTLQKEQIIKTENTKSIEKKEPTGWFNKL